MLVEQRGKQFDPALIDAFVALQDEFARIASQLADDTPDDVVKIQDNS